MNSRKPIIAVAAGMLALGVAAGSGAASAQTTANHGHTAALKGTIQSVAGTSLQLQTSTGAVTVAYTAKTHVEKIVAGTTADLTANARVSVQLKAGTTTVTAIRIEPAFNKPAGATTGTPKTHTGKAHPTTGTHTGWKGGTTTKKPVSSAARSVAGGLVAGLTGNTLTLSGRGGTTAAYTLASTVKITKIVAGTTASLARGETVQVFAPAGGAAREITILAA